MIAGVINERAQAMIQLTVQGAFNRSQPIEFVLDTGFNSFVCLPHRVVEALQLPFDTEVVATLAAGRSVSLFTYDASVMWGGAEREVTVLEAEGDALLGMAMLANHRISMEVRDGGLVSIESLA